MFLSSPSTCRTTRASETRDYLDKNVGDFPFCVKCLVNFFGSFCKFLVLLDEIFDKFSWQSFLTIFFDNFLDKLFWQFFWQIFWIFWIFLTNFFDKIFSTIIFFCDNFGDCLTIASFRIGVPSILFFHIFMGKANPNQSFCICSAHNDKSWIGSLKSEKI